MIVRIPKYHNKNSEDVLSEIVAVAADRHGIDNHGAALFLASFLELVMDRVSQGREVTIPGFGKFASSYDVRRHVHASERKLRPKFLAATAFKQTVRVGIAPSKDSLRRQRKYSMNHRAGDGKKSSSRSFSAMARIRNAVSSQVSHLL